MKVAFVTSEIAPFASTGGLAEVCGSLPSALDRLGLEVISIMPLYRRVMEGNFPIEDTGIRLSVPVGFHQYRADVWKSKEAKPGVYFIRRDEFFDRSQLYNLPDRDYDDNFERFIFFQKAVSALIDHLRIRFDVIHAHDWQTGLLPLYLRHGMSGEGRAAGEKVVFTIHNLAFQGTFSGDEYSYTNLPFSCFSVDCLEYYGNVNTLKAGIISADAVTTVSNRYAKEIQTEEFGCGLHGVLWDNRHKLFGIQNGLDIDKWNPETDPVIAAAYSADRLKGKTACRRHLIKSLGLRCDSDTPILGMVTRLSRQKGLELIDMTLPKIMQDTDACFVLVGDGSSSQIAMAQAWQEKWPGRVVVFTEFDHDMARRIFAGADIFLMPSKYEPCGLNQLCAIRYGTIPVVHDVGGLSDTVVDPRDQPETWNGFKFREYRPFAFYEAIERAIHFLRNNDDRNRSWQARIMRIDHSWDRSAVQYADLYQKIIGGS